MMLVRRRRRGWGPGEKRTAALAAVAASSTIAAVVVEVGRIWRRGPAPLPHETEHPFLAAEQAVEQTVEAARAGYSQAPDRANALFNLLASFVATFLSARGITYLLRGRGRYGPLRNMRVGHRHIHHFVPGIVLAFVAGAIAICTEDQRSEPMLAIPFGAGMGLTLDESALLLELEDVYWSDEGLLSVQITLAVAALLGALGLGLRFVRRGERLVLARPGQTDG
jgi:hypothetical protein